jgi:death-on-curing protein
VAGVRYLTADDVLAITYEFFRELGYTPPRLRGNGRELLESAVNRAQAAAYYASADLLGQAAALTNGIALGHPFIDGNKRAAFAACVTLLRQNGRPLRLKEDRAELARQIIAIHELTDRSRADHRLRQWLSEHTQPAMPRARRTAN